MKSKLKLLTVFALLLTFVLALSACSVGGTLLAEKTAAKNSIDTAVSALSNSDYDEADWTALLQEAATGKTNIDAATKTDEVATAKNNALSAINAIPTKASKALESAKQAAKDALDAAFAELNESNYAPANWQIIISALESGKSDIDAASTTEQVTAAKNDALDAIGAVELSTALLEANAFKSTHATVLALTVANVAISDKTAVNTVLNEYGLLSGEVKALLTAEKELLDSLVAKITELENIQAATAFKTTHTAVLALSVANVAISDKTAVNTVLNEYGLLSGEVKALLTVEKELLDSLIEKIAELENIQAATAFKTTHATVLALTTETFKYNHIEELEDALSDYELLSGAVKALLADEKALLDELDGEVENLRLEFAKQTAKDALDTAFAELDANNYESANWQIIISALESGKSDIDAASTAEQITAAKNNALDAIGAVESSIDLIEANAFKITYAAVFALTVDTIEISDKTALVGALSGYSSLRLAVKALLTTEKELLDNLSAKITELENIQAATAFKSTHATVLALTVANVAISDKTAVNTVLSEYGLLSGEVKALLTVEKELLDSLSAKIAELENIQAATAFKTTHATVLALTTATFTYHHIEELENAFSEYDLLSGAVQALLVTEKALLDELNGEVAEQLNVKAADEFKSTHATVLALTTATFTYHHIEELESALSDYELLSGAVKALLTPEKTLLDELNGEVEEQLNVKAADEAADDFKSTHATVLALTAGTVTLSHKAKIGHALEEYALLGFRVQELLIDEKAKLDSLNIEITRLDAKVYLADLWTIIDGFGVTANGSYQSLSTASKANIETQYELGIFGIETAVGVAAILTARDNAYDAMKNAIGVGSSQAIILMLKNKVADIEEINNKLKLFNEEDYDTDDWAKLISDLESDYVNIRKEVDEKKSPALLATALARLDSLETSLAKALAREAAEEAIDELFDSLKAIEYTPADWETIINAVNSGKANVAAAKTIATIGTAGTAVLNTINNIVSIPVRQAALNAIESEFALLTEGDYEPTDWSGILSALATGRTAIGSAATPALVASAKTNALNVISGTFTIAGKSQARQAGLDHVAALIEGWEADSVNWTAAPLWANFKSQVDTATGKINNANTQAEIDSAITVLTSSNLYKNRQAKYVAKAEIKALYDSYNAVKYGAEFYFTYYLQTAYNNAIASTGTDSIEAQTSADNISAKRALAVNTMNNYYVAAVKNVLRVEITAYIGTLTQTNYASSDWAVIIEIRDTVSAQFSALVTADDVEACFESIMTQIEAIPTRLASAVGSLNKILDNKSENPGVDAYNLLLMLAQNSDIISHVETEVPGGLAQIAQIIVEKMDDIQGYTIAQTINSVLSVRKSGLGNHLATVIEAVSVLYSEEDLAKLNNIISLMRGELSAFDKGGDIYAQILAYNDSLTDYAQQIWDVDWKDDYFITINIYLDDEEIGGIVTGEAAHSFKIRVRDEQGTDNYSYNATRDAGYKALLALGAPEKGGFRFDKWQLATYWQNYMIPQGMDIKEEGYKPYNDEFFTQTEDLREPRADVIIDKLLVFTKDYPGLGNIQIFATWIEASVPVSVEEYYGTWTAQSGTNNFTLVIAEGNGASSYSNYNPSLDKYIFTHYFTFELQGDGTGKLYGNSTASVSINQDGNIEYVAYTGAAVVVLEKVVE